MNLNRDFLKTLGGVLIIGAIVVVTFLYGNQQRQEQIRKDQAAKEQAEQQAKAKTDTAKKPNGGTGGGNLPTSTPQTGGEVFLLAIPAAGVGAAHLQRIRRRRGYTL